MSTPELDILWRLAPGQGLLHRAWSNETLLFNDLSGDTHLLDASAMAVLLALQAGPQGESALLDAAGLSGGPDGAERLAALLADLEILSLIQAC